MSPADFLQPYSICYLIFGDFAVDWLLITVYPITPVVIIYLLTCTSAYNQYFPTEITIFDLEDDALSL